MGEVASEKPFLVCEASQLSQQPLPRIPIIARMLWGPATEEGGLLLVASLLVLLLLVGIFVEMALGEKIFFGLELELVLPVQK